MKIEKNKIVFAGVIGTILLFLGSYVYMLMTDDDAPNETLTQPEVPKWEETESDYATKLEAIDALKKEREVTLPSVYPEHMMDDKGYFNPDYMEYEKQRIIDSLGEAREFSGSYQYDFEKKTDTASSIKETTEAVEVIVPLITSADELALEHQLFFAARPKHTSILPIPSIPVEVDGKQVLQKNSRIRLRLTKATSIKSRLFPKHTILFGTVRFRPNRVLLHITQIGQLPLDWQAYDLQDGMTGLYLENSLREEATQEVVDDVVQDINIAGLPQVRGLKTIFQRRQRNLKVTVLDGHRLFLKPNTSQ